MLQDEDYKKYISENETLKALTKSYPEKTENLNKIFNGLLSCRVSKGIQGYLISLRLSENVSVKQLLIIYQIIKTIKTN